MLKSQTDNDVDQRFIALCCAMKALAVARTGSATHSAPSLQTVGLTVQGHAAIVLTLEAILPEPSLFPNANIGMPLALIRWTERMAQIPVAETDMLAANADLIARQLHDGRAFLQGAAPGLADICSASWLEPRRAILPLPASLNDWLARLDAVVAAPAKHAHAITHDAAAEAQLANAALLTVTTDKNTVLITSPLD